MCTLERIIVQLKKQNKKQKELTDFLGLTKNTFTNWKLGTSESYKKYISQIAEFLNVSADYLLGKEKEPNPDETLLFALYGGEHSDITPEMLEKVREFARFIREEEKRKKNDN